MVTMFRLEFEPDQLPFKEGAQFHEANFFGDNTYQFYAFFDETLHCYYYDNSWKNKTFTNDDFYDIQKIYFTDVLNNGQDIMIATTSQGVKFFQYESGEINLLNEDTTYEVLFEPGNDNNSIDFGHFYDENGVLGLLSKHKDRGIEFFRFGKNRFDEIVMIVLGKTTELSKQFLNESVKLYLNSLFRNGKDDIIVQSEMGLSVYGFKKSVLEKKFEIACCSPSENDRLHFGTLSGSEVNDIVYINSTGLYLHQYDESIGNYRFLNYHPLFSKAKGWLKFNTDSIQFNDVDFNGNDEMIFTGPQGLSILSYNSYNNKWESRLDNSKIDVVKRHGRLVYIFTELEHSTIAVTHNDHLYFAKVDKFEEEAGDYIVETVEKPSCNQTILRQPKEFKRDPETIFLRNHLDYSFILNPVNPLTGRINFEVPLVDLPYYPLNFKIVYDYEMMDKLGHGWITEQNLIALDPKSIFSEDYTYYHIWKNAMQELKLVLYDSEKNSYLFRQSKADINIVYYKNLEQWVMRTPYYNVTFGNMSELNTKQIHQEWTWQAWRESGSSTKNRTKMTTGWYLSQITDVAAYNKVTFTYLTVVTNEGKEEIYLNKIFDNHGNNVVLKYKNITTDELTTNGQIPSLYLSGYTLTMGQNLEEVDFNYTTENNKRLLTEIKQKDDVVLGFAYNDQHLLENVTLPTNASVRFKYETIDFPPLSTTTITAYKDYKIFQGSQLIAISSVNNYGLLTLNVYDNNLNVLYSTGNDGETSIGTEKVQFHQVHEGKNYLVVLIDYKTTKDLYIYPYDGGKFLPDKVIYHLTHDSIIRLGTDFVIVANPSQILKRIEWNGQTRGWDETNLTDNLQSQDLSVASFYQNYAIYDDKKIALFYKNHENIWQSKIIKNIPNLFTNIKYSLLKFDEMDQNIAKRILFITRTSQLQFYHNIIMLTAWKLTDKQITSEINLFVLNENHDVVVEYHKKFPQENLETWKYNLSSSNQSLTFSYLQESGKMKFRVSNYTGELCNLIEAQRQEHIKAVDEGYGSVPQKQKQRDEINKHFDTVHQQQKGNISLYWNSTFILDWTQYYALLNRSIVVSGKYKVEFDGTEWKFEKAKPKIKEEKKSILLGDKFVLERETEDAAIKLYRQNNEGKRQGSPLFEFEGNDCLNLVNKYPVYVGYQEGNSRAQIVRFKHEDGIETFYLPVREILSQSSSHFYIITTIDSDKNPDLTTLIFRSLSVKRFEPAKVVKQMTINFDGMEHRTGYDYNITTAQPQQNTLLYRNSSQIPGNNKTSFGWIEQIINDKGASKIIYNGYREIVKNVTTTNEIKTEEDETIDRKSTLFDKSNVLPVAQFFTYEITSGVVSYLGFEDYEVNKDGREHETGKQWIFNDKNIVRNQDALTGENYLMLSSDQVLTGSFYPRDHYIKYVTSAWVRPSNDLGSVGMFSPYLKITVSKVNNYSKVVDFLSEIKFRSHGWFYVESIVDLNYTKFLLDELDKTTKIERNIDQSLKITVVVSTNTDNITHVDHIRFSPLNCRYQANVYNHRTRSLSEVIQFNGLIKRYLYDKYEEKIATINEYGRITEFSTYTKYSGISVDQQIRSNIQIEPEDGLYISFSKTSCNQHWTIDDANSFISSRSQIKHVSDETHTIHLKSIGTDKTSYGLRLNYFLNSGQSNIIFNNILKIEQENEMAFLFFGRIKKQVPLFGEILLVIENSRLFVWIEGTLYIDKGNVSFNLTDELSLIELKVRGQLALYDLMIFSNLNVVVSYFNAIGEKVQEIKLEDENHVIVTEFLYDELGRQSITTKALRIRRSDSNQLLAHYKTLVLNGNPHDENSIFRTGKLLGGDIETYQLGFYDYSEIKYHNNPLDEELGVGYPGEEFSIGKTFSKTYDIIRTDSGFKEKMLPISQLYPTSEGHRYQVEKKPGNVLDVLVDDSKGNRVAWYIHVPNGTDLLCTYEYNRNNKLIKLLPPMYHKKAKTLLEVGPKEDQNLQDRLGTHITYDNRGRIRTKSTPDTGRIVLRYDENGLLKYQTYYSHRSNNIESILLFKFDELHRITHTGHLIPSGPRADTSETYQEYHYNDEDIEPFIRGRLKQTITFNTNNESFIEESFINDQKNLLRKRVIFPVGQDELLFLEINKRYSRNKLIKVEYPGQPFSVTYGYDKLGNMVRIGVEGADNHLFSFKYNPIGQVTSETHFPNSVNNFTRSFSYNDRGFLIQLKDKFLIEEVYYTEAGYGGYAYGDGTITQTKFTAHWHDYCFNKSIGLDERSFINDNINAEHSKTCYDELKLAEYIDRSNHQAKVFYPELETSLPIVCSHGTSGRYIAKVLGETGYPKQYGHVYDYGNHQELTKAKYYVGNEHPMPLQPDTFAKELNIDESTSRDIWRILTEYGFIIPDQDKLNLTTAHGKQGDSFISKSLISHLNKIGFGMYLSSISKLLVKHYADNTTFSQAEFLNITSKWKSHNSADEDKMKEIYTTLNETYFKNPISTEFNKALEKYNQIVPGIIKVLIDHFGKELGKAEFDVESYGIDANGNHVHYYTGFERYEMKYQEDTNRIETVKHRSSAVSVKESSYTIEHDGKGNIIEAMHKGIKKIYYHPVSNRATKMELLDGRYLTFFYDANGERILKKVFNKDEVLMKEVYYIRDEFGRSLVEREFTYISIYQPPDLLVTVYIYGPRGLIGFIRRDEFYSVISDHEYSVRLIVKSGEVVAAYDYLPYGNLMREYGSTPESHINYRYTGQEWDQEIGLYNYHARFYDPNIGRFYQIDPKEQYYSPYKYAGNSPISTIDPTGEIAFLLVAAIIFAIIGAYLGGAAANESYNLAEWDWTNPNTYVGMAVGGLTGAMLVLGAAGSFAFLTTILHLKTTTAIFAMTATALVTTYLRTASANESWDPSEWDFTSPQTWSSALAGFSLGIGLFGIFGIVRNTFMTLSYVQKIAFVTGTIFTGATLLFFAGSKNKWDFSKPGMWSDIAQAIFSSIDLPMFVRGASRYVLKNSKLAFSKFKATKQVTKDGTKLSKQVASWVPIVKLAAKILGGGLSMGVGMYAFGTIQNDNFLTWDMSSVATYHALLEGLLIGGGVAGGAKTIFRKLTDKTSPPFSLTAEFEQLKQEISAMLAAKKLKFNELSDSAVKVTHSYIIAMIPGIDGNLFSQFVLQKMHNPILCRRISDRAHVLDPTVSLVNKHLSKNAKRIEKVVEKKIEALLVSEINIKKLSEFNIINDKFIDDVISDVTLFLKHSTLFYKKEKIFQIVEDHSKKFIADKIADSKRIIMKNKERLSNKTEFEYIAKEAQAICNLQSNIAQTELLMSNEKYHINSESQRLAHRIWNILKKLKKIPSVTEPQKLPQNHGKIRLYRDVTKGTKNLMNDILVKSSIESSNNIEPEEKCHNCEIGSSNTEVTITDPSWSVAVNNQISTRTVICGLTNKSESAVSKSRKGRSVGDNHVPESGQYFNKWITSTTQKWPQLDNIEEESTSTIKEISQHLDGQSSLLLANVIIAKLSNNKMYTKQTSNNTLNYTDAMSIGLNLTDALEHEIKQLGLPEISVDFNQILKEIMKKLMSNKLDEIGPILTTHLSNAFNNDSELTQLQLQNLKTCNQTVNNIINTLLNKSLQKLFGTDMKMSKTNHTGVETNLTAAANSSKTSLISSSGGNQSIDFH